MSSVSFWNNFPLDFLSPNKLFSQLDLKSLFGVISVMLDTKPIMEYKITTGKTIVKNVTFVLFVAIVHMDHSIWKGLLVFSMTILLDFMIILFFRHYRRKHPHMFEALSLQQRAENHQEDKVSADEKMKVALELKGLSDEEISERVKALIQLSEDGVWMCKKCKRFVCSFKDNFLWFHDFIDFFRRFDGKPKRALYSHIRERHFHMRHFKCKE